LPVPEGDHAALEYGLMAGSTTVALLGFGAAYFLYAKGIHPMTESLTRGGPLRWLHTRVVEKWHVDELYDAVVVQPIAKVSEGLLYRVVDVRLIDGTVNGVGWLARKLGFFGQLFQSGNVQRYIAIFAMGLAVLLYGWLTPFEAASGPSAQNPAPIPAKAHAVGVPPAPTAIRGGDR